MKKTKVLYVMYSSIRSDWDEQRDQYLNIITKIHGIFTEKEISKYQKQRKWVGAECMIVPLNKFIEVGVEL